MKLCFLQRFKYDGDTYQTSIGHALNDTSLTTDISISSDIKIISGITTDRKVCFYEERKFYSDNIIINDNFPYGHILLGKIPNSQVPIHDSNKFRCTNGILINGTSFSTFPNKWEDLKHLNNSEIEYISEYFVKFKNSATVYDYADAYLIKVPNSEKATIKFFVGQLVCGKEIYHGRYNCLTCPYPVKKIIPIKNGRRAILTINGYMYISLLSSGTILPKQTETEVIDIFYVNGILFVRKKSKCETEFTYNDWVSKCIFSEFHSVYSCISNYQTILIEDMSGQIEMYTINVNDQNRNFLTKIPRFMIINNRRAKKIPSFKLSDIEFIWCDLV